MKILILGIGNILLGDEGMGSHLIHLLNLKYRFDSPTHTLSLIDGGTLSYQLIPTICEHDTVILVDCIAIEGGEVGGVYRFDFSATPKGVAWQGSAHEVEMFQTLQMIEILGELPPILIWGAIPRALTPQNTFRLSQPVAQATKIIETHITSHLTDLGFDITLINDITIDDVVMSTYRGE